MSLILLGTILSGLLFSKILLMVNLENMVARYPIVVLASYMSFFAFIRLWLFYIQKRQEAAERAADISADIICNSDLPDSKTEIEFGGGEFGGGGASGSFEDVGASSVLENSSSGVGELAGEAGGSLLEEGGIILIPLMLLLAAIFGVGILLIYEAPVILSEAAFEFILAGVLVKKAKEIDSPDWIGSVFKNTWKPFIGTLVLSIILSYILGHFFPEAVKLSQIFFK